MKGQKLFLTSWPHGKLVHVEVIERNPAINNGWYIRYATGGTDTTTSDFLFHIPVEDNDK
jgi:hypothetical protein